MRSHTTFLPARRTVRRAERRLRRRPVLVVATLALGLVATAGFTTAAPASQAEASGQTPDFALASYTTPLTADIAGAAAAAPSDADAAVTAANNAMTAASTVTSDIAASGLDVGTPDTTVDTTELSTAVEQLERAQAFPAMYSADFEGAVTTLTASVSGQTAGLRGKLDAAVALKAKQEAEEKARKEAEAAAAAKAAAEAAAAKKQSSGSSKSSSSPSSSSAPAPSYAASGTSAGEAQATAHAMVAARGWGDDQFACLVSLWNKESGWRYNAANPSGAYGIPQALPGSKMGAYGADWQTNPATQIAWGLGYISGRYGNPCGAWGHSQSTGWY
jgi:hypothetical protein